jgi:hypothetical protein
MQSKFESILESILNTMSAYVISTLVYYYLIPIIIDIKPNFVEANITVIVFTIISIVRNYIWRRVFNKRLSLKVQVDRFIEDFGTEDKPWNEPDFITPEIGRGVKNNFGDI